MSFEEELRRRFGGFWNTIFLIVVVVVCLRFAGAEWAGAPLGKRLLVALCLFLGCTGLGIPFSLGRIFAARSKPISGRPTTAESIAWGLKYGVGTGTVLLVLVGALMVKDFLGPLLDLLSKLFEKLVGKIP